MPLAAKIGVWRRGAVRLRPIRAEDVTPAYVAWMNDPETNRFLETRYVRHTAESVAAFVAQIRASADSALMAIEALEGDAALHHIGNLKIGPVKRPHALAAISLFIGSADARGRRYGGAAVAIATKATFRALALEKLTAGAYAQNVASLRAFEAVGFQREGLRRAHYVFEGGRADVVEFGLLRSDYRDDPAVRRENG